MFLGERLDLLLDFCYGTFLHLGFTQAIHRTYSVNQRNLCLKKCLERTAGWNHIDTSKAKKENTAYKATNTVSSQPAKGTSAKLGSMDTIA